MRSLPEIWFGSTVLMSLTIARLFILDSLNMGLIWPAPVSGSCTIRPGQVIFAGCHDPLFSQQTIISGTCATVEGSVLRLGRARYEVRHCPCEGGHLLLGVSYEKKKSPAD